MGNLKTVCIMVSPEFREAIEGAAKLKGMNLSNFIRYAVSDKAGEVYSCFGKKIPGVLVEWEMRAGGDFSEIRAAKDPNYKKRTLSDKINKAKEKAKKQPANKRGTSNA